MADMIVVTPRMQEARLEQLHRHVLAAQIIAASLNLAQLTAALGDVAVHTTLQLAAHRERHGTAVTSREPRT